MIHRVGTHENSFISLVQEAAEGHIAVGIDGRQSKTAKIARLGADGDRGNRASVSRKNAAPQIVEKSEECHRARIVERSIFEDWPKWPLIRYDRARHPA